MVYTVNMSDTDPKKQARSFLNEHSVGVLATVSSEGGPRARTVYYASTSNFQVFFFTLSGTRKVADINGDHRAAFVVSDTSAPQTLQMEGVLTELPDTTIADPIVKELMDTLMEKGAHFAPLTHLDASRILFYKITPTWIRWGDFTKGDGTDEVLLEITV